MFLLLNCKIYWIHHYVHYPILQHVDHGDPAAIFRLHLGIQCTNVYVFFFLIDPPDTDVRNETYV